MEKQNLLLDGLDHIRKRPLMYFSDEVPAIVNFLEGFKTACLLMNPAFDFDSVYQTVIKARHWEHSATPIWQQMRERDMDDNEVIAELLAIQKEIWSHFEVDTAQAVKNEMN